MNPLANLLQFLSYLNAQGIGFMLASDDTAVMALIRTESGVHEVAFFADGAIEITSFEAGAEPEQITLQELLASDAFKG
jgi:hypothetical protein